MSKHGLDLFKWVTPSILNFFSNNWCDPTSTAGSIVHIEYIQNIPIFFCMWSPPNLGVNSITETLE